jgi:hypothetical protein
VSYQDVEASAKLADDPEQQGRLRQAVDDLARRTLRGALAEQWLFPLDAVSYLQSPRGERPAGPALLNVSAVTYGSHRHSVANDITIELLGFKEVSQTLAVILGLTPRNLHSSR